MTLFLLSSKASKTKEHLLNAPINGKTKTKTKTKKKKRKDKPKFSLEITSEMETEGADVTDTWVDTDY